MTRAPDREGKYAEAWKGARQAQPDDPPAWAASLETWLITHVNGQFVISLIHLRHIEGVRPALKRYPEAEYEVIVSGAREFVHDPDVLIPTGAIYSTTQFHVGDDTRAREVLDLLLDGVLNLGVHALALPFYVEQTATHVRVGTCSPSAS